MKRISIILIFGFIIFSSFGQKQNKGLTNIKIYMVKWDSRYQIVRTIDNIKKEYLFYFETKDNDLIYMFDDYSDCMQKLMSQDTINYKYNASNICVELLFGHKKVTLYFLNSGDYYFNGKWYKMNSGLYYSLFSYFSNDLIPYETLNKAKLKSNKNFWIKNE